MEDSLKGFPELWKAPILHLIQYSYESCEKLAAIILEFVASEVVVGEVVRIKLDDELVQGLVVAVHYPAVVGGEIEYRVHLLSEESGEIRGEAVFKGASSFVRERKTAMTKAAVKKLIRFSANRLAFPASPWILRDEIAREYGVHKEMPAEVAQRIGSQRTVHFGQELAASDRAVSGEHEAVAPAIRYPIDDEELPMSVCKLQPWPQPAPVKYEGVLFSQMLSHWTLLQAFSAELKLLPFSLDSYCAALDWRKEPNPIWEAVCVSLLQRFVRERQGLSRAAFGEMLACTEFARAPSAHTMMDVEQPIAVVDSAIPTPESVEDDDQHMQELLKIRWSEPIKSMPWWRQLLGFLADVCALNAALYARIYPMLAALGATKAAVLGLSCQRKTLVVELLCQVLLQIRACCAFVEDEVEKVLDARKRLRHVHVEQNKVGRDVEELEATAGELREQGDAKGAKRTEMRVRHLKQEEGSLFRKSEACNREIRKHGAVRIHALGRDRDWRTYWWLDAHTLVSHVEAGCGRVFVEDTRGEWHYYDEPAQVAQLLEWLNPLGIREAMLKARLLESGGHIEATLRKWERPEEGGSGEEESDEVPVVRRRGRRPKLAAGQAPQPRFAAYVNVLGKK